MITVMSQRSLLTLILLAVSVSAATAGTPSLLRIFGRISAVEADPSKSYTLSEEDGPWLILAATLVGEGSKQRAQRLALEIRKDIGLAAFIYQEKFDFTGTLNQGTRSSKRVHYANRYQYDAYAVLVGEYDSVEHPSIDRDLQRIRTANPAVYQDADEVAAETNRSNPVTTVKSITSKLLQARKGKPVGPMGHAFVTRNPMLPQEYFAAPKVDSFVHQLNDGLDYSLLKCDGKYTVIVKTFQGVEAIVDGKQDKKFQPSESRLNKFAKDTGRMTAKLRADGVEAYQYHDRFRSMVTVGSFEVLGRELPDGRFEYAQEIRAVVRKFSALNVSPERARQVPRGTKGRASNNVGMIPFDVQPTPIAVPKPTKRSLYGAALGMR
jgi:hypothetical protein